MGYYDETLFVDKLPSPAAGSKASVVADRVSDTDRLDEDGKLLDRWRGRVFSNPHVVIPARGKDGKRNDLTLTPRGAFPSPISGNVASHIQLCGDGLPREAYFDREEYSRVLSFPDNEMRKIIEAMRVKVNERAHRPGHINARAVLEPMFTDREFWSIATVRRPWWHRRGRQETLVTLMQDLRATPDNVHACWLDDARNHHFTVNLHDLADATSMCHTMLSVGEWADPVAEKETDAEINVWAC